MAGKPDRPGADPQSRGWSGRGHTSALIWPLFALFVLRHYGYANLPAPWWPYIYGGMGSLCLVALLCLVPIWWPVKAWMMGEELLTAGCSFGRIAWPEAFHHAFQDELCSQAVGLKLGSVGLVVVSLLALRFFKNKEQQE